MFQGEFIYSGGVVVFHLCIKIGGALFFTFSILCVFSIYSLCIVLSLYKLLCSEHNFFVCVAIIEKGEIVGFLGF